MDVYGHQEFAGHERVNFIHDAASGLRAIIAIHSTRLGPAAGGVRMWPYPDVDAALTDALRLSRAMSYKNSFAGLPLGGGKSVIIGDPRTDKSRALLAAFASAVQNLSGTYWCAEDVGMGLADVGVLGEHCDYVFGLPAQIGDPAPHTATGVLMGMAAAVEHVYGAWPDGLGVAVQGVGNVGYQLCRDLSQRGARLFVADVVGERVDRVVESFGATAVTVDEIYDQDVEVFAPCALGGVLDAQTVPRLRARVVAGSANNQLATMADAELLAESGVLYVPDFVVNAGGMLSIGGAIYGDHDPAAIPGRLETIYRSSQELLERAKREGTVPARVAVQMAQERIDAAP